MSRSQIPRFLMMVNIPITPRVVGMKDDFGAPHRRPSHRLGIAPALMADRHSKLN
jgi:hypothetical protein